jgi:hypothetical protein
MAVLLLCHCRRVKLFIHIDKNVDFFYDFEKTCDTFGPVNRIMWDVGIELFTTHRARSVLENWDKWDS